MSEEVKRFLVRMLVGVVGLVALERFGVKLTDGQIEPIASMLVTALASWLILKRPGDATKTQVHDLKTENDLLRANLRRSHARSSFEDVAPPS